MIGISILILSAFITGCINPHDDNKMTTYTISIELDMKGNESEFMLYCPFLNPLSSEVESYDQEFLEGMTLTNSNILIDIEVIKETEMINISGIGSFVLTSSFQGFYWDIEEYGWSNSLRESNDYSGDYDIYFKSNSNLTLKTFFHMDYECGDNEYGREGSLTGDLENTGWQTIIGEEITTLSD